MDNITWHQEVFNLKAQVAKAEISKGLKQFFCIFGCVIYPNVKIFCVTRISVDGNVLKCL